MQGNEDIRKKVLELYTPLSVAKEEVWRRWNDKKLRKKVEDFLGGDVPEFLKKEPKAAVFRNIATPNFESRLFLELAGCVNLNPIYIEFTKDRFCTRNQDKLFLGKMTFCDSISDGGHNFIVSRKIIDIKNNDNKSFDEISTLWGEKLIDFHHRIFCSFNKKDLVYFDASRFKCNGESAMDVYVKVLSFFICNGILFENYIAKDNHYEKKFTETVVLPAVAKVKEIFKVKPLIVPFLPIREEANKEWMWYSHELEKEVSIILNPAA